MTDDELIAKAEKELASLTMCMSPDEVAKLEAHRLISLARIGASVMPRPIEEAPKDGTKILLMGNGPGFWATQGQWVEWAAQWRDATSCQFELVLPHSWLPLSALQVKP